MGFKYKKGKLTATYGFSQMRSVSSLKSCIPAQRKNAAKLVRPRGGY